MPSQKITLNDIYKAVEDISRETQSVEVEIKKVAKRLDVAMSSIHYHTTLSHLQKELFKRLVT